MSYIDGFVIPVPADKKQAYLDMAAKAAPIFREPLRDGAFSFIADCSREEAEHIVRGLNNVAIKLENQPKPPKAPKAKAGAKPAAPKPDEDPIKAFKEAR